MEITTKSGKIEKQGVCLCEDRVDSAVGSQRESGGNASQPAQSYSRIGSEL